MNKICLSIIFTSMCIALSSCNLISKSSSSDESSTSDINTYDALSSIVNARAKPERVKISKREYYEMCDLKDVSKCPFDPIKNRIDGSCSNVRIACKNAVWVPREIPEYENPEKLYEHMMRADDSNGHGATGYYLVKGEVTSTISRTDNEKYKEVRRKHIKEIFYHFQNQCTKDNIYPCMAAQEIYQKDYPLVKKFFPKPSPLWPKSDPMPTNESSYSDNWYSGNKYFDASSNFCSGIQVYKSQIAVALGEPLMGLYVLSRTSTRFYVEEVSLNRKGFIPSKDYGPFNFGDRKLVAIGNPIEAEILTDSGVCKFGWIE